MSDEKVLTKEIAEQFLAEEDSVDLSEFTTIEDGAAESLSKSGSSLWLNGLTTLSECAATSLSGTGRPVRLQGLKHLTPETAKTLEAGYNVRSSFLDEYLEKIATADLSLYENDEGEPNFKKLFEDLFDELQRAAWDDEKHPGFADAFRKIVEKYEPLRGNEEEEDD